MRNGILRNHLDRAQPIFLIASSITVRCTRKSSNSLIIQQTAMVRQPTCDRNRAFTVKIVLPFDEKIEISDVCSSTGVLELKDRIEVLTGIPR